MTAGPSTRWLGALSLLGLGSACNDACEGQDFQPLPEPDPSASTSPEVLAGEWIGSGVLELSFSEPLSAIGDLDPNRFALVAWDALQYEYRGSCYLQTRYQELAAGYYYYYQPANITAVWIAPEDDTLLRLRVPNSVTQCPAASDSVANGLVLVYTDDGSLGEELRDENGNAIADLGPAWAVQELDACIGNNYCGRVSDWVSGHLPQLTTLAPIPCP